MLLLQFRASSFGAGRQTKTGVTVAQRKFPGAFKAKTKSGRNAIFRRVPNGTRRSAGRPSTSSPNLPVKEPTVSLGSDIEKQVIREINGFASRFFKAEFERRLRSLL